MQKFLEEEGNGHLEFHKRHQRWHQRGAMNGLSFDAYTKSPNQQIGLKSCCLTIVNGCSQQLNNHCLGSAFYLTLPISISSFSQCVELISPSFYLPWMLDLFLVFFFYANEDMFPSNQPFCFSRWCLTSPSTCRSHIAWEPIVKRCQEDSQTFLIHPIDVWSPHLHQGYFQQSV